MSEIPSLEELLARRGILKNKVFNDYQDYILEKEKELKKRKTRLLDRILKCVR